MALWGRTAAVDIVPFDPNHTCVLCTWEWEVPLAHLLSRRVSIHNSSCDLILSINYVLGIMLRS